MSVDLPFSCLIHASNPGVVYHNPKNCTQFYRSELSVRYACTGVKNLALLLTCYWIENTDCSPKYKIITRAVTIHYVDCFTV